MSENPSMFRTAFAWAGGYIGCAAISGTLLGGAFGLAIGITLTQMQAYKKQHDDERALIEPFLADDPAFKEIQCRERSNGGVYLMGTVPTKADRDRLRERVIRFVGERRAEEIMRSVQVFAEQ